MNPAAPSRPLALCLLLLLSACALEEDTRRDGDALVRRIAETAGEAELLQMEDEHFGLHGGPRPFLKNRDPQTRRRAALAVGRLGDRQLTGDLKELLADRDKDVRGMAAYAAGLLGDPTLAPDLLALLGDESQEVRASALFSLGRFGGGPLPEPVRDLLRIIDGGGAGQQLAGEACLAAASFSDPQVPALLAAMLGHPDAEVRWKAAFALGRLHAEGAALAGRLGDPDGRVRAFAALGTAASAYAGAVPALLPLLQDPDTNVVAAAAEALGALGDASAADALVALSSDPLPRRRHAAIAALSAGALAPARLAELAQDASPQVRALAVDGLGRARGHGAALRKAVTDEDWRVRAAAARALTRVGDINTLAATLQYDRDARVVPAVLDGLARLQYPQLPTVLLKHLADKDPVVRATAARLVREGRIAGTLDGLVSSYDSYARLDDLLVAKLAVIETLADQATEERALNPIKQAAMDQNWVLKTRAYPLLVRLGAAGSIEPPQRVNTLRSEGFYRDLAQRGDYDHHLSIDTDKGRLVFRLYPKLAPMSVRLLDDASTGGYFQDLAFSEMEPARSISDGDDRGDGFGHYPAWVRDEPHDTPFRNVHLTLKRPFGRDSGTSQFVITYLPRPELDGVSTNVGELIEGAELLDQLVPGDTIRNLLVTVHEFRGRMVMERVDLSRPVAAGAATTTAPSGAALAPGGAPTPAPFQRSSAHLAMAVLSGLLVLMSIGPAALSAERREDVPLALWVMVLIILAISGLYTALILTGQYFDLLTSETKFMGRTSRPILGPDAGQLACFGVMAYILVELLLLYFLVAGRSFARWAFLLLSLVEIALFTAQIATGSLLLSIIAQVGIVANLLKIWFLLMDRRTKEYLAPA